MFNLFNTLSGKKEQFEPLEKGKVKIYTCGPTVYDYAHIGNFAAYLFVDTLRRFLEYQGFEVRHIVNITDVGHLTADDVNQADSGQDKMLKAALREKKTPQEIANFYTDCFFEDIAKLNIKKAQYYPRASAHIPQMIKIIENLIRRGLAYESNGNVFYDVEQFAGYGKLSKKKLDQLKAGARLEEHPDKKHPYDFALWLKAPKEHLLKWDSPWSEGYPGWHIECSAMSMEYLGTTLDIHTGGEDHIFPHHENEIAQSEGATGQPFSRFWFHNRFLLSDGQKMSKSKGNFFTLRDVLERGYEPMHFRLLILSSHYRSNANFTWTALDQAKKNFEKISRFVEKLESQVKPEIDANKSTYSSTYLSMYLEKFSKAMEDDLNTPLALAIAYELAADINKQVPNGRLDSAMAGQALACWNKMNEVFGLQIKRVPAKLPMPVRKLLDQRLAARNKKNFDEADRLRDELATQGYLVEDTPDGQKVTEK